MSVLFNLDTIKYLIKLFTKYEKTEDTSPHEFVKHLVQLNTYDANTAQYLEMFLELHKHDVFLTLLSKAVHNKARGSEKMYIKIIMYGILFRFEEYCFRKYFFNLEYLIGKKLLKLIMNFLRKIDVILIIKNIAQSVYDVSYVTDFVSMPFIKCQAYIQEVLNDYVCFQKQEALKNIKPKTVPVVSHLSTSTSRQKKDLPSDRVDKDETSKKDDLILQVETLAEVHERNLSILSKSHKRQAEEHLREAQNLTGKYAQSFKSNKFAETIEKIELERNPPVLKVLQKPKYSQTQNPVKTTVSSLLRFSSNIIKEQENEIKWIEALCSGTFDSTVVDELANKKRIQEEKDQVCRIEKKHLKGLLSHEEAKLAKENLLLQNKESYEKFLEEKRNWERQLEEWKTKEQERMKIILDSSHAIKQAAVEAKEENQKKKKEIVKDLREQSDNIKTEVMKKKMEELQKRFQMIQEIKTLQALTKTTNKNKVFDFTETVGLGLMCEMSLVELKERLSILKIDMKEELESRKKLVCDLRDKARAKELRAQEIIAEYLQEKKTKDKTKGNSAPAKYNSANDLDDEISLLKSKLEEKRRLRMLLTKNNLPKIC